MRNLIKKVKCKNKVCPICGKPYVDLYIKTPSGQTIHIKEVADCDCIRKEQERLDKERRQKEKQEKIIETFWNPLMGKFLRTTTFDNLKLNKNIKFCQNFVKHFKPHESNGLQLIGDVGTGKTTLLAAMCHDLMKKRYTCLLIKFSALLKIFTNYSGENFGGISNLLDQLCRVDFLAIDDIGQESYSGKRPEFALEIVDALLTRKITTLISGNQYSIDKLCDNPDLAPVLDRIRDLCPTVIQFDGESYRGKNRVELG